MLNLNQQSGITAAFATGGLAEGTNANTFKTTATVPYAIDGVLYSKAATDNLAFSAGHTSLAAGQSCLFGVVLDTAGNVTTVQGPIITTSDLTAKIKALHWPVQPAGKCMIGAIRVQCDNAAVFVPNTTDLGAADVVDTYYNLCGLPSQPLAV